MQLVALAVAVIAATAGGVWWFAIRANAKPPLFSTQVSADYGVPSKPETTDIGDITFGNSSTQAVTLMSITTVAPTRGLIATFDVVQTSHPSLGVEYGRYSSAGLRPPAGFVVAPSGQQEPIEVIAFLHPAGYKPGRYTSRGVEVHYRMGSRRYTLFIDEGMTTCFRVAVSSCHAQIPVMPKS